MENEIKTFVYRTGKACEKMNARMKQLKKKVAAVAASVVVLVALITTVSVIASDEKRITVETVPAEVTFSEAAAAESVTDTVTTPEITYTNISKDAAEHKDIPLYAWAEAEADESLMLLGIDTEETQDYIPEEISAPVGLVYSYNTDMILNLDAENLEALERIVEAEACDQDLYGKILVANVVINRVYAGFADTVKGVIFQKLGGSVQFSPVRKGGSYYTVKVSEESKEAVRRALSGEDYSQGAIYFFQRSTTSARKAAWFDSDLKFLFKYGTHEFFKEKH